MSKGVKIIKAKSRKDFSRINNELTKRGFVAIDALKPGVVRSLTLGDRDPSNGQAQDLAACIGNGAWSNGPLSKVAWAFDARDNSVVSVTDKDGKELGLGYVKWGAGNNIPSVIPPLAMSSPYTASPLRYIADLITGLGARLMYRFPDGELVEYRDAGERLRKMKEEELEAKNEGRGEVPLGISPDGEPSGTLAVKEEKKKGAAEKAYEAWERTWYGYDVTEDDGTKTHVPGAKEFLEENNINLHFSQCQEDGTKLDIYFPAVGFQRGRRGRWGNPKIVRCGFFPASIVRMERRDQWNYTNHCYVSDQWRTLGASSLTTAGRPDNDSIVMYPCAMPQNMLQKLRDIVERNQRTAVSRRPTWVICPTFYPSGNKPYYPQPAWWSIFTSKAFDFSSTILYDKAKQRENNTSWGKLLYVSLDYLDQVFGDEGYQGNPEKQQKFIDDLEQSMESFLQHRENHGKMMRQWMWTGQDGKEHHSVEIVDIAEATNDEAKAGKEELELSTSPIFLALGVDPRLVGVPMVAASNGGTALREMHLLKQQQLNVHQRNYCQFLNNIAAYNGWDNAEWHVVQQTLTTLDTSKTGTKETISSEGA